MNLKSARPHEALAALIALKGPLTCVTPHMVTQMPVSCESAPTVRKRALEGFFAEVDPHVRLQVTFLSEALSASLEVTDEWFLSLVGPLVDLQSPRP